jgi:2-methylcitrate dehydratase
LTAARWGFYTVLNKEQEFELPRPFGTWVAENVVFKVLTAEGHGLTAVEATMAASKKLQERGLDPVQDIKSIRVRTQAAAMTIINKKGPLHNPADRDHCLRYMIAVVLLKNGVEVETEDYQNDSPWAKDPRVEDLRSIISMEEDVQFTQDYFNHDIRSVASSIEFSLKDGTKFTSRQDFPLGHPARNEETIPRVRAKAIHNLELKFSQAEVAHIMETLDKPDFDALPASKFIDMFQNKL